MSEKSARVLGSSRKTCQQDAIELLPSETSARVGLARMLLAEQHVEEARQVIEELADAGLLDAEGEHLQAEMALQREAGRSGGVAQCRLDAEAAADDLRLQLRLATSLAAAGKHEEAMEICLRLVAKDPNAVGKRARELAVLLLHLLGPESEQASTYRRKLTTVLHGGESGSAGSSQPPNP